MAGNGRDRITRRGFLEAGSAALVGTTLLADAKQAGAAVENAATEKASAGAETGKIALEEHFAVPELFGSSLAMNKDLALPRIRERILDTGGGRIAEMDRGEVELAILSFVAPGIQAIPNPARAIEAARRTNDYLAEQVAKNPKRLRGFAALPLQEPQAAAQELTRCVKELGLCGTLVNGFSQVGEADSAVYYDLPQYRAFWATVQDLDVPFYLHPRAPLPSRRQAYEGHPWMVGSAWGFAAETSIHALRLMGSGLFDEYPKLKIILGHLGEGIPFNIWRVDHRVQLNSAKPKTRSPIGQYLRENFYITTSGNFRTQALMDVISEVGSDRVMYSADYPFEDMVEAKDWFDGTALSAPDRARIARGNAQKLFRL